MARTLCFLALLLPSVYAAAATWQAATCPRSGRVYYWNSETMERTWQKPAETAAAASPTYTYATAPPPKAQGMEASFEELPLNVVGKKQPPVVTRRPAERPAVMTRLQPATDAMPSFNPVAAAMNGILVGSVVGLCAALA